MDDLAGLTLTNLKGNKFTRVRIFLWLMNVKCERVVCMHQFRVEVMKLIPGQYSKILVDILGLFMQQWLIVIQD